MPRAKDTRTQEHKMHSYHSKEEYIEPETINSMFRGYKYAIPEHPPIKLSNGQWLHTYRLTKYNDNNVTGDEDVEQDAYDYEQSG